MNELISLLGAEQDAYGPVQLPAYEGLGAGVQKIGVEIETVSRISI